MVRCDHEQRWQMQTGRGRVSDYNSTMTIMHAPIAALSLATLYHGHPCPSSWLGPELSLGTARLSLRQEGRTRVEALVEGGAWHRSREPRGGSNGCRTGKAGDPRAWGGDNRDIIWTHSPSTLRPVSWIRIVRASGRWVGRRATNQAHVDDGHVSRRTAHRIEQSEIGGMVARTQRQRARGSLSKHWHRRHVQPRKRNYRSGYRLVKNDALLAVHTGYCACARLK